MNAEEEEQKCDCPDGLPPWLATFADLMSLLMCFFVLLLSFSEMDVLKFKQLAGSLRQAFGIQSEIKVKDIPKGTSIIAQEFSPGRPEPTPLNEVRQFTTESTKQNLDVRRQQGEDTHLTPEAGELQEVLREVTAQQQEAREEARKDAVAMAMALQQEIAEGSIDIETQDGKVIIRVREKGSFESGQAELNYDFIPVIAKIRDLLLTVEGSIAVQGHTDNIPISNNEFTSNWALSSARALSVAQEIFADSRINESKFRVTGLADTKPLAPNTSPENRMKNRRVEIVIHKGKDEELLDRLPAINDDQFMEPGGLPPADIF